MEQAATAGIGDDDKDANGVADTPQDQAETGGSGGEGMTRHEGDGARRPLENAGKEHLLTTDSGARGAQDTRAKQAGPDGNGLGSPETGANQVAADLPPPRSA